MDLIGKSLHCTELGVTTTSKDDFKNLFDLGFFPFASLLVVDDTKLATLETKDVAGDVKEGDKDAVQIEVMKYTIA